MLRIFIISLLLCNSTIVFSQNALNDSLLSYEYAYFKSNNDTVKQMLLLKKIDLYLKQNITDVNVLNEVNRVNVNALTDNTAKVNFLWNATAIAYLNNNTDRARFFLAEYSELKKDTSVTFNLLAILINKYADTSDVNKRIAYLANKDTVFKDLSCFLDIINYNRKHLKFYLISSAIIPGSGTAMNGYVFKGITSLALMAGSVYGIIKMVEYGLYINAVLWGTGVSLKFYAGNIKLTQQSFYKAEDKKKNKLTNSCELKLKNVLNRYPLTLKGL
ncbi:MAG: hypothetical protein H0W73_08970 [Bacteroidetes bacterium]|nr:hypothetical protein [Bacteroidota bacterium]